MSSAYVVDASVVEPLPPDIEEGEYRKVHRDLGQAIADFCRLIPVSEDVTLHYSS